jgi:predicted TIM-barrel fold metal-dependent hydrolase
MEYLYGSDAKQNLIKGNPMSETILDADSHVSEPLNLWQERLPEKYRAIAPHMETEYRGQPGAWWHIEPDRQPHNVILGFGANKSMDELQKLLESFSYAGAHRGGWDPAQRLKDMDQDGVAGDVLYTTLGFRMFWIKDAGFQRACFQAYNDWLAEFCAHSPKRLKGLALISLYDPKQAAIDLADCAKKGLAGAIIWASPPDDLPFHSDSYDPFWAAAQELKMPLSLHEFAGFKWVDWDSNSKKRTVAQAINSHEVEQTFATLIVSGVLERFPNLKVVSAELNCGWVPFFSAPHGRALRSSRHPFSRHTVQYQADAQTERLFSPPALCDLHRRHLRSRPPGKHRRRKHHVVFRLSPQRDVLAQVARKNCRRFRQY